MTDQLPQARTQLNATMDFAHAYRCERCVPDILVQVDEEGFAMLDVVHEQSCNATPFQHDQAAQRAQQTVEQQYAQPLWVLGVGGD